MDTKLRKTVVVGCDTVMITYTEPGDSAWRRIVTAARFLAHSKLGPNIVAVDHAKQTIETEKVFMFANELGVFVDEVNVVEARAAITDAVRRFHDAGWIHGDLSLYNIGYRNGRCGYEVAFIDYDTVHKLEKNLPAWLRLFREEYLGTENETYKSILHEEETVAECNACKKPFCTDKDCWFTQR